MNSKTTRKYLFGIVPATLIILFTSLRSNNTQSVNQSVTSDQNIDMATILATPPCGFTVKGNAPYTGSSFTTDANYPALAATPAYFSPGTPIIAKYVTNTVYSPQHKTMLSLQPDGNLVLYDLTKSPAKALWASGTAGSAVT
ncbi:hypothetical protein [Mucilaginibacter sp. SP1R1]|uniref:hypothetical protein n=1 Tax=Mucilaginibacter sp. SP1R1 TaxID=2723091 RepID=UPI0016197661|nr:hypothetical protein [Mucilaginibacter sp. SP1R1]MBB6147486.1 hypothetical protein [Mucilaginibacter sp. SP1R1]